MSCESWELVDQHVGNWDGPLVSKEGMRSIVSRLSKSVLRSTHHSTGFPSEITSVLNGSLYLSPYASQESLPQTTSNRGRQSTQNSDISNKSIRLLICRQISLLRKSAAEDDMLNASFPSPPSTLQMQYCQGLIESPEGSNHFFIPAGELRNIFTFDSVFAELASYSHSPTIETLPGVAKRICLGGTKLFAILVHLGQGHRIYEFLGEGICDKDLPLERSDKTNKSGKFKLCSKLNTAKPINCMMNWNQRSLNEFSREQWVVEAPVFEYQDTISHYNLHPNCVLPFVEHGNRVQGGYSTVLEVVIHPDHQRLIMNTRSSNHSFALKRLLSTSRSEFILEVEMLKACALRRHPNIVKLLCTMYYRGYYYLIFPFSKSNLRQYWQMTPVPTLSRTNFRWMLNQCKDVVSAIRVVHDHRNTQQRTALMDSEDDDRFYGRHGDIKPENILFSLEAVDRPQKHIGQGTLLIADFGLMDIHRRATRSMILPDKICVTSTYEPPEVNLRKSMSRAYDIWGLGCVFLEFIIWLISGWDALQRFHSERTMPDGNGMVDDKFYTRTGSGACVRESVNKWMDALRNHPWCSNFVADFLDLISHDMLIVDHTCRIRSGPLYDKLLDMVKRSEIEPTYV